MLWAIFLEAFLVNTDWPGDDLEAYQGLTAGQQRAFVRGVYIFWKACA